MANARAVHFGLMIGLALGSELAPRSIFHRKNYFYPDLPKGYQISQYDEPLCRGGELGEVRIHRVHLEEDAAKLIHVGASGRIHGSDASIVDFNRGGTPLAEIVTEPDMRSAEQASEWLKLLRSTLRQLGVSDVNMEEGSLRCDANISLRPPAAPSSGVKTELKNMNSFRFIERGIRAEIARQEKILQAGGTGRAGDAALRPRQRRHHLAALQGGGARLPLLPRARPVPVAIGQEMIEAARADMAELPADRAERLRARARPQPRERPAARLPRRAGRLLRGRARRPRATCPPQTLANWVTVELVGRLDDGRGPRRVARHPGGARRAGGDWWPPSRSASAPAARSSTGSSPTAASPARSSRPRASPRSAARTSSPAIVAAALQANADAAERVREGNAKAIGPIVGYVMRETKGRADGTEVARLVHEQLGA